MATIKDVAKEAGVSIGTVSRVLNDSPHISAAAKLAVDSAVAKLGYRKNAMAQALVSKKSNMFGVVVSDVGVPFFGALVNGIDKVARSNGQHLLICNGYHDAKEEREMIERLLNNRCQSLVVHSKGLSDKELIKYSKEVPGMVLINRFIPELMDRCVFLNNQIGTYNAVSRLLPRHNRIAYVGSSEGIPDARDRLSGYETALADHGRPVLKEYIMAGEPIADGGFNAATRLCCLPELPDAIVTYNDAMAAGVLEYLQSRGYRVPEDISVIGFDDVEIAKYLYPKLTTMRYPIRDMAKYAAELAINLANGLKQPATGVPLEYQPKLIQRNSAFIE